MKKAVLFDFHNTLATCDAWLDLEVHTLVERVLDRLVLEGHLGGVTAVQRTEAVERFERLRSEVRSSGVEMSATDGARRVLTEMAFTLEDRLVADTVESLEHALLPEVEIVPGASMLLAQLRAAGCRIAVVSSAGLPSFVERALEQIGLLSYFDAVVTSAGEDIYKSDPEIFLRAVRKLGVAPGSAVHIGDHPIYDVRGAKRAGLATIWFDAYTLRTADGHRTPHGEATVAGGEADAVVSDLSLAFAAIEQLQ